MGLIELYESMMGGIIVAIMFLVAQTISEEKRQIKHKYLIQILIGVAIFLILSLLLTWSTIVPLIISLIK